MKRFLFVSLFALLSSSLSAQSALSAQLILSRGLVPVLSIDEAVQVPTPITQPGLALGFEQNITKNAFFFTGLRYLGVSADYNLLNSPDNYIIDANFISLPILLGFQKEWGKWSIAVSGGWEVSKLSRLRSRLIDLDLLEIRSEELFRLNEEMVDRINHQLRTKIEARHRITDGLHSVLGLAYSHGLKAIEAAGVSQLLNRLDMSVGVMYLL